MDDLAALVAACAAHPDEDTPRLVLADWLDEHPEPEPCPGCGGNGHYFHRVKDGRDDNGELRWPPYQFDCVPCSGRGSIDRRAAWGELIRVQVELANTADPHGDRFWDGQLGDGPKSYQLRKTLRARARDALPLAAPLLGVTPDGRLLDTGPCPCITPSVANPGYECVRYDCPDCSGSGRRRVPCVVERGWPVALLALAEAVGGVNWTTISEPGATITMRTAPTTRTPPVPLPPGCGVRVTDREPLEREKRGGESEFAWASNRTETPIDRWFLPHSVWDRLDGGYVWGGWFRVYTTSAAALAALHAAVREFRMEHFKRNDPR